MKLVLGSHRISTPAHQNLNPEALTGFSHFYSPGGRNITLLSQGCILGTVLTWNSGNVPQRTFQRHGGDKEPPTAQVQLTVNWQLCPLDDLLQHYYWPLWLMTLSVIDSLIYWVFTKHRDSTWPDWCTGNTKMRRVEFLSSTSSFLLLFTGPSSYHWEFREFPSLYSLIAGYRE